MGEDKSVWAEEDWVGWEAWLHSSATAPAPFHCFSPVTRPSSGPFLSWT